MDQPLGSLDETTRKKLLNKGTLPFRIAGIIFLCLMLICMFEPSARAGGLVLFGVPAAVLLWFGFRRLLWSQARKESYILLRASSGSGSEFRTRLKAQQKEELYARFETDSSFQSSVLEKVRRSGDKQHDAAVNRTEQALRDAEKAVENEILRIDRERWHDLGYGLKANTTEGILRYNGRNYLFTDILGAQPYSHYTERHNYTTTGSTKRSPSIGKAVVGGVLFGGVGAVIGGLSGSSESVSKTEDHVTHELTSHGIYLNLGGFTYDIKGAPESLVHKLQALAQIGIPQGWTPVEEMPSVLEKKRNAAQLRKALADVRASMPEYTIPEKYCRPGCSYSYDGSTLSITGGDKI